MRISDLSSACALPICRLPTAKWRCRATGGSSPWVLRYVGCDANGKVRILAKMSAIVKAFFPQCAIFYLRVAAAPAIMIFLLDHMKVGIIHALCKHHVKPRALRRTKESHFAENKEH